MSTVLHVDERLLFYVTCITWTNTLINNNKSIPPCSLLPREEPEARTTLEQVFESEGIIRPKGSLTSVKPVGKEGHEGIVTKHDGSTVSIAGDVLLVAVGRIPNVKGFGLHEIGVTFNDKGGIMVNDKLQTNVKNVYAAGDCTGDLQLYVSSFVFLLAGEYCSGLELLHSHFFVSYFISTHYAGYQGAIAARNILLPLKDQGVIENVPSATFTSPEVNIATYRAAHMFAFRYL